MDCRQSTINKLFSTGAYVVTNCEYICQSLTKSTPTIVKKLSSVEQILSLSNYTIGYTYDVCMLSAGVQRQKSFHAHDPGIRQKYMYKKRKSNDRHRQHTTTQDT